MNVAGPSRPRPFPGARENYEEDLTRMIAQLELSDIQRLQTLYEHRGRQGQGLSDREVAFSLLLQNARELAAFNADRALAQQLQVERDEEDGPAPRPATVAQPAVAPQRAQPTIRNTTPQTQSWGEWFASLFVGDPIPSTPTWEAAAAPIRVRAVPRATGHDCVICQDPIVGAEIRAPCNHFYDIGCITDLYQSATRDESLYPPRCCRQDIPLQQVRPHLTQALLAEFELKAREFGTPKRVYCAAPACSRFLGPLHEGYFSKVFKCTSPTCTTSTCGKCRGRHEGYLHNCTPDAETAEILTLSRASGWSRCPGCAQMIELNMGCFHMTCRCRTQFCYLCSARWKNCRCPQWDENRLLAAAERRVDAQLQPANRVQHDNPPRQAPAAPPPLPAVVAARNQDVDPPAPAVPLAVRMQRFNPPAPVAARIQPHNPPAPVVATRPTPVYNIRVRPTPDAAPPPAPPPPRRAPHARVSSSIRRVPTHESNANTTNNRNTVRERMIRETVERLRVDHDCEHTDWTYRRGGGRCESCSVRLPFYLFSCRGCQILTCNRCRRNRL